MIGTDEDHHVYDASMKTLDPKDKTRQQLYHDFLKVREQMDQIIADWESTMDEPGSTKPALYLDPITKKFERIK